MIFTVFTGRNQSNLYLCLTLVAWSEDTELKSQLAIPRK